jgi:hypothetical protein
MSFSDYVHGLAKYEPAIKARFAYILACVYTFMLYVCMCVIYSHDTPPDYKDDALFSTVLTIVSIVACLVIHEHPSDAATFTAVAASFFSGTTSIQMFRTIYGEHKTCSKLYKNLPALDALSSRLDELSSAGSVVSVDLLSAEATETISHYSGLCLKLHAGDGAWYTAHMAVLYVVGILCVVQALGTIAFTIYNNPGARKWLMEHTHALMHLMSEKEVAIKAGIEKAGKAIAREAKHLKDEGKQFIANHSKHHNN